MRLLIGVGTVALAMLVGGLVGGLAGCSDGESDQRKAFVSFLQTRIIDKPGLHVPQLTADERKAFGRYADQYGVITGFHQVMNDSVSPKLTAAMNASAIQSVGDLVGRQGDLHTAKTVLDQMAAALSGDLAQADAAHGKLDQPQDVRVVFDAAYARLVTTPAATFAAVVPVADKVLADALDLGGYIEQHKREVTVTGATVQVSNAAVLREVNARLQGLQASQQAVQTAQSKLQAVVYGSGG